jgi:hypothetical protein
MNKDIVIIFASSLIFNPTEVKIMSNLSLKYSIYLNSLLTSNWIENLTGSENNFELITLFNEKDKEFIPKNFFPPEIKKAFYTEAQLKNLDENILGKLQLDSLKIIVLFHNSIGLNKNDILRMFSLVHPDEASVVVAKSKRDKIILTCLYGFDNRLFESLLTFNQDYISVLNQLTNRDILIHTLDGYLSIDDFEDIKKLYIELSKKESLSYCSPTLHERFNDLFIEYKDLLNG